MNPPVPAGVDGKASDALLKLDRFSLAGFVRRTNVGFDEETKSGWSVLIRGFAEAVPHSYLLTHRPGSPDRCPGRKGSATC